MAKKQKPEECKQKVAEYINAYRKAQGGSPATVLPGLADVARYRAAELQTDFSHNSKADVCTVLKYGEYIDMTFSGTYQGSNNETHTITGVVHVIRDN